MVKKGHPSKNTKKKELVASLLFIPHRRCSRPPPPSPAAAAASQHVTASLQEEARALLEQADLIPPTPDKAPRTPLAVGPPIPFRHQLLVEAGNLPTGDARIATGLDPGDDGYDSDASASSHSSSHAVMRCTRARGAATNNDAIDEDGSSDSDTSIDLLEGM